MRLRTLTILFSDLVASTERFGALTHREADELRRAHFEALRVALDANAGTAVKWLGDGIHAVFGSAGGALSCAGAMQRSAARQGLGLRVGISTGDVVGDEEGDWHGRPVVEASRLTAQAAPGQVLAAEIVAVAARGSGHDLEPAGARSLRGLGEPVSVLELRWEPDRAPIRVVVADDSGLVRDGLARLLEAQGLDIVGRAADAHDLLEQVDRLAPEIVVSDIRMPPHGDLAGLTAAERILERHPGTGVVLLSTTVETHLARRLLAAAPRSVGYLSKDRVADAAEFAGAVRAVAAGETVLDPALGAG